MDLANKLTVYISYKIYYFDLVFIKNPLYEYQFHKSKPLNQILPNKP